MSSVRKKGQTIHSSERELIRNVIKVCDQEAKEKVAVSPVAKATERAARYCNVSVSTIKRIRRDDKRKNEDDKLTTPGKKRRRPDHRNCVVDSFDRRVILDVIQDFYINKNTVPSIGLMLPVLRDKISFKWSERSLRRVLYDMGFKWKKCNKKRKILIERPDIVNWRFRFLQTVRKSRQAERKIFYLDETAVDSNLTFSKCWQSDDVMGVLLEESASKRLIVVHIGSEDGFLKEAGLVFQAGLSTGDYHGNMNFSNFSKWIVERVIPNLPPNSTIIMDNAPYHNKQVDKPPTKSSLKKDMLDWLARQGQVFSPTARKADLFDAIQLIKPAEKVYKVDSIFKNNGHQVIRLPPYMCDLNAIELAWSKLKHVVRQNNTKGEVCITKLKELVHQGIANITSDDWQGFVQHTKDMEELYWRRDGVVEDAIDRVIVNLGVDDTDTTDESSEEDSSGEDICSDEAEDLAMPLT